MRKFDRHDAAAIRRAVHAFANNRTLAVEAGERKNAAGVPTFDSTKWPKDSELVDIYELNEICEEIDLSVTLDLYVFDRDSDAGDGLIANLDARWNGTAWEVFDPFSSASAEIAIPKRKAVAR